MSSEPEIQCKRLSKNAIVPTKGSKYSAGFDLYANLLPENITRDLLTGNVSGLVIQPGERKLIPTGISLAIPETWYGRIAPRSGLAFKNGIDVLAGVIDSDYRAEIKVILLNTGKDVFTVSHLDRIAQIIIEKCGDWVMKEVDNLDETERGFGGFGSTGK